MQLLSFTGPQAIRMVLYYSLLAHWLSIWYSIIFTSPICYPCGTVLHFTGTPAIPMVVYYLHLADWLSLWYSTIFYYSTGYSYGTLLSSPDHRPSLLYSSIFYRPTVHPYSTLLFSIGPPATSRLLYYHLLVHWRSL